MEDIFSGVNVSEMTGEATNFMSAFGPYVALLVGLLLAFFVIQFIVSSLTRGRKDDDDDFDDDDYFDDEIY